MKKKYIYNNINLDSKEEYEFILWCEEAKQLNIITDYQYHEIEYILSEKNDKFRRHIYTPDFKIIIAPAYKAHFPEEEMIIDVKGAFAKFDGERAFTINRKWVYDKYNVFIHKVVPKDFFKEYGIPKKCRFTEKTNKERTIYKDFDDIEKVFLKNVNNNI